MTDEKENVEVGTEVADAKENATYYAVGVLLRHEATKTEEMLAGIYLVLLDVARSLEALEAWAVNRT